MFCEHFYCYYCVCVYTCAHCICVFVHACMQVCKYAHLWTWLEIDIMCLTITSPYFLRLHLAPVGLTAYSANSRDSPVSASPMLGVQAHGTVPGFLPGCLGSGLRCSCFHSKHLTNWAIFPASCLYPPPPNRTGWNQGLLYARQVSTTEPHPYPHFALRWSLFQVAQSGLELTL